MVKMVNGIASELHPWVVPHGWFCNLQVQSCFCSGIRVASSDGPFALRKVEAGLYGFSNQNFKFTKLGLYLT